VTVAIKILFSFTASATAGGKAPVQSQGGKPARKQGQEQIQEHTAMYGDHILLLTHLSVKSGMFLPCRNICARTISLDFQRKSWLLDW